MFAITGITGNVGGNVARNLLAAGRPVRAVMCDVRKGDGWAQRGCELATADILDVAALASAFEGAEGVFVLVPPNFDPAPSFPEARATAATLKWAIERARPGRVVYLSTIGAQAGVANLLTQHTILPKNFQNGFVRAGQPRKVIEFCSWAKEPASIPPSGGVVAWLLSGTVSSPAAGSK